MGLSLNGGLPTQYYRNIIPIFPMCVQYMSSICPIYYPNKYWTTCARWKGKTLISSWKLGVNIVSRNPERVKARTCWKIHNYDNYANRPSRTHHAPRPSLIIFVIPSISPICCETNWLKQPPTSSPSVSSCRAWALTLFLACRMLLHSQYQLLHFSWVMFEKNTSRYQ